MQDIETNPEEQAKTAKFPGDCSGVSALRAEPWYREATRDCPMCRGRRFITQDGVTCPHDTWSVTTAGPACEHRQNDGHAADCKVAELESALRASSERCSALEDQIEAKDAALAVYEGRVVELEAEVARQRG